jgi:hypothetical protein
MDQRKQYQMRLYNLNEEYYRLKSLQIAGNFGAFDYFFSMKSDNKEQITVRMAQPANRIANLLDELIQTIQQVE